MQQNNRRLLSALILIPSLLSPLLPLAAPQQPKPKVRKINDPRVEDQDSIKVGILSNIDVIGTRNQSLMMNSKHIGATSLSRSIIAKTPVLFGESDLIKTLQMEPGVAAGVEGFAGLYVHGGDTDENQYTVSNIPLYQVNHLGGLFSAFNTETVRSADFYKSTFPAQYDGRLSSYIDVFTRDGATDGYHGSLKLGLISGAFNIEGPLYKDKTTFSLGVRHSWLDVLTTPALLISNRMNDPSGRKNNFFGYGFTDLNAKIVHRLSPSERISLETYWGNDYLSLSIRDEYESVDFDTPEGGFSYNTPVNTITHSEDGNFGLSWGNLMTTLAWEKQFRPNLSGKIAAAVVSYSSSFKTESISTRVETQPAKKETSQIGASYENHVRDALLRGEFKWILNENQTVNFGGVATFHNFLPNAMKSWIHTPQENQDIFEGSPTYRAGELHLFGEEELRIGDNLLLSGGLNLSGFTIDHRFLGALSPRLSFNWGPSPAWRLKGGYSRTSQYVHQLSQSIISLPTDLWLPIMGNQKPITADKLSLGCYHPLGLGLTISGEVYYKWLHNVIDYRDDIYMVPGNAPIHASTTTGRGTSKGLDLKLSKESGPFTGHLSYSLLWANRQYDGKNNGNPFPARFDNRHKFNIFLCWEMSKTWETSLAWVGMSGNRITLPSQSTNGDSSGMVQVPSNNYRLPFFHRLDLSLIRHTAKGYWTFSLYNLYNQRNVAGIVPSTSIVKDEKNPTNYLSKRVYYKITLFPLIPSISYTWLF